MLCVFIAPPYIRYLFMKVESRGQKGIEVRKRKKGYKEEIWSQGQT